MSSQEMDWYLALSDTGHWAKGRDLSALVRGMTRSRRTGGSFRVWPCFEQAWVHGGQPFGMNGVAVTYERINGKWRRR